ncbi:MAG: thioredoxin family protein [Thermomicrobiales bacterium]
MTYPDHAVIAAVAEAFVPLRLDVADPRVRELNIVWLPTVVIRDHRGHEHYRNVNAAPPADFLDVLALGEAHARLKEGRREAHARAEQVLAAALGRREDGPLHPELLYWHAIAGYTRGDHDGEFRDRVWADLMGRYPDSIWAHRVPEFLTVVAKRD